MATARKRSTQTKNATDALRDRVVELRKIKASELKANDMNWRLHPDDQRGALQAMFEDVGFVGAIIARETKNGEIEILDGHLRAEQAGDAVVPVLIVDLDEDEAKKILATYDTIAPLAVTDTEKLGDVLDSVILDDNAHLRKLIQDIEYDLAKKEKKQKEKGEKEYEHPDMALRPHEHYDYLVVLATSTHEWNVLCDRLALKPEDHPRRKRMGTCRAIKASALLPLLKSADGDDKSQA